MHTRTRVFKHLTDIRVWLSGMRVLRRLFFFTFFVVTCLSLFIVLTLFLFIMLGMLIQPLKLAPYGLALIGTLGCAVAQYVKLSRYAYKCMVYMCMYT